jgi:hypothetical protein
MYQEVPMTFKQIEYGTLEEMKIGLQFVRILLVILA